MLYSIEGLSDMEYRKFVLHGTFEHDKEVYIGPRSLIGNEKNETGGIRVIRGEFWGLAVAF